MWKYPLTQVRRQYRGRAGNGFGSSKAQHRAAWFVNVSYRFTRFSREIVYTLVAYIKDGAGAFPSCSESIDVCVYTQPRTDSPPAAGLLQ